MNLRNFLSELKRRNAYKVAGIYAIVGWLGAISGRSAGQQSFSN